MKLKHPKLFYSLLIIVFALNATLSNAACCVAMDVESSTLLETVGTTGDEMNTLPCHGSADTTAIDNGASEKSNEMTNCCSACLVMLEKLVIPFSDNVIANSDNTPLIDQYRSTEISSLFRPPIHNA